MQRRQLDAARAEQDAMMQAKRARAALAKTIARAQAIRIAEAHLKVEGQHRNDAVDQENGEWRPPCGCTR